MINKVKISNPKISLMNFIGTPPTYPGNNTLAIADPGANINLAKQATTTMAPVITSNEITSRLPDGSTMEYSHIVTLQLPGLSKKTRKNHISPKTKNIPTNIIRSIM